MSKFGDMSSTVASVLRPIPIVAVVSHFVMAHIAIVSQTDAFGRHVTTPLVGNNSNQIVWFSSSLADNVVDTAVICALLCSFVWLGLVSKPNRQVPQ